MDTQANGGHAQQGFTLLEVLVALVIVGTAMMATWSAENRLTQMRLSQEWPPLGRRSFACAQAELPLRCEEQINPTPNPAFRRVEVTVVDERAPSRKIITLSQIVPNAV